MKTQNIQLSEIFSGRLTDEKKDLTTDYNDYMFVEDKRTEIKNPG
jgi:hypothetical protein